MAYFMLYTQEGNAARGQVLWAAQFGDESRSAVDAEARDWVRFERDTLGRRDVALKTHTRVVRFADVPTKAEVDAKRPE